VHVLSFSVPLKKAFIKIAIITVNNTILYIFILVWSHHQEPLIFH